MPKIVSIKGTRLSRVKKRWEENPNEEFFVEYFNKILKSDFLSGRSDSWKCFFDWAINPTNMQKVLEGNYTNDDNNWLDSLRNKPNDNK